MHSFGLLLPAYFGNHFHSNIGYLNKLFES
jgi:hypothetical protein